MIKGAASKKGEYKVCFYTEESVYRGLRKIYLDALKDEANKKDKLPVHKLIQMLFILFSHFTEEVNEVPWNTISMQVCTPVCQISGKRRSIM